MSEENKTQDAVKSAAIAVVKVTFGTLKFLCEAVLRVVDDKEQKR